MEHNEITEQLEKIEALRNAYEVECKRFENSNEAIRAFHTWHMAAVELFVELFGEEDNQLRKFQPEGIEGNGYVLRDEYHAILGTYTMLKVRVKKYGMQNTTTDMKGQEENVKLKKIFISHSHDDEEFAKALVNLLVLMGFEANKEIFCSSVPDCWVEDGEDFIDVIKKHFDEYELYVIYIHSPRFYNRHITLNEMGAAWVLQSAYSSFLTSDMSFGDMDAVVPKTKVAVKVDDTDAEARMNSWRKRILTWFGKEQTNDNFWETSRDRFLSTVREFSYPKQEETTKLQKEESELFDKDKEILKQWVNSGSIEMYKAEYMGGGTIILGDEQYTYGTAREEADWNDFFRRLLQMGFIESTGRGGDSARYLLTAKAYKYFD